MGNHIEVEEGLLVGAIKSIDSAFRAFRVKMDDGARKDIGVGQPLCALQECGAVGVDKQGGLWVSLVDAFQLLHASIDEQFSLVFGKNSHIDGVFKIAKRSDKPG